MDYLSDWFNVPPATIFWCSLGVLLWAGIFLGACGFYAAQQLWQRFRQHRRQENAQAMQERAAKILENLGFSLQPEYMRQNLRILQDGQPLDSPVRPELFVNKGGKSYVVNIKERQALQQLSDPHTRQQLLEYYVTYKPNGILLMDMENRRIHDIRFDLFASDF